MRNTVRIIGGVILLVMATTLQLSLNAERALAHARLETATPAPDAVVAEPPVEIRIWMTQELTLSGNGLEVTDAYGTRVDNYDATVDQTDPNRRQLAATLQPLAPGPYTVTYTASSAEDGHVFTESYVFTVDPAAAPAAAPATSRLDCAESTGY